jgi:superfamily II helicase
MVAAAKEGAAIGMGIDLPAYQCTLDLLPESIRAALVQDFDQNLSQD